MEESLSKLFAQFGVSGLIGGLLWIALKELRADMRERIGKLETKVDACEKDREKLWERLANDDDK